MWQAECFEERETLREIVQNQPEEVRSLISRVERYVLKDFAERLAAEFSDNEDISLDDLSYDDAVINQVLSDYETIALKDDDKPEI